MPDAPRIELQAGASIALLLWAKTPSGEDDVAILIGTLKRVDGTWFIDRGSEPAFELREEWLPRIVEPPASIADVTRSSKFLLSLSVGNAEDEEGPLQQTGLKWPRDPGVK